MISLSQGVRPLLDLLQLRSGVSLEVVDAALRIASLDPAVDFGGTIQDQAIRERCLEVIRSGEHRIDRTLPTPTGFYPLRRERQIVGVLIVSARPHPAAGAIQAAEPPQFELAGQLAKAAIEHDLALTAQLAETSDRTRRLEGVLRFLTQLTVREGERPMMNAVVHAATVWFDVDCRVYRREDDSYAMYAALPGVDRGDLQPRIDAARIAQLAAKRRISGEDLDLFAWRTRRGELLVLPVGRRSEWVMLLAGVVTPEVEVTFTAIAQVLAGALQEAANRRQNIWKRRLDLHTSDITVARERVSLQLLHELAAASGAAAARLTLHRKGTQRTLAAVDVSAGPAAVAEAPEREGARFARVVPLGTDAEVRLELTPREGAITPEVVAIIDAWIDAIRPWLQGAAPILFREAVPVDAEATTFERRIQDEIERAKRFDLNLGLILIAAEQAPGAGEEPLESVQNAIRTELRASDLTGRVRGGRLGVLLVHAGAESAEAVARRLRQRLTRLVREASLRTVHLGQTTFSPERQTTHDLIRDAIRRFEELHPTAQ